MPTRFFSHLFAHTLESETVYILVFMKTLGIHTGKKRWMVFQNIHLFATLAFITAF